MCAAFSKQQKKRLRDQAALNRYEIAFYDSPQAAAADAADAEILYGQTPEFVSSGKEARWIHTTSAGIEPYLLPGAICREDCILTNASGSYGLTISEHLVMVALMLLRRQPEYTKAMDEKYWKEPVPLRSIYGSRITIIGTGDIGSNAARRFKAFSPAKLTGINRSGNYQGDEFDLVDEIGNLDRYLPETDLLILCTPETPETIGLLSGERIRMLNKDAFVINVGRGSAIDQEALAAACNEGRIAGSALDVMTREPLPEDDPLWDAKNCLLTPHISGNMSLKYTVDINIDLFLDNLDRYCSHRPLRNVIDRERGY